MVQCASDCVWIDLTSSHKEIVDLRLSTSWGSRENIVFLAKGKDMTSKQDEILKSVVISLNWKHKWFKLCSQQKRLRVALLKYNKNTSSETHPTTLVPSGLVGFSRPFTTHNHLRCHDPNSVLHHTELTRWCTRYLNKTKHYS